MKALPLHQKVSMRRRLTLAIAALPLLAMSAGVPAADFPTAKVNTTGLAVTDKEVTVGQLHSATGTMAISETGSIQAERLAIDQINATKVVRDQQIGQSNVAAIAHRLGGREIRALGRQSVPLEYGMRAV